MSGLLDALLGLFRRDGARAASATSAKAPDPPPAPPADADAESIRAWLAAVGIRDDHARALAALALPAVRLRVTDMAVDDWPQVGTSKLGGVPDVPADFTWPRYDGLPLMFIAQVNLAELATLPAASALPSEGMLAFFYGPGPEGAWGGEPKDRGSARVFWFPDAKALRRAVRPRDLTADGVFAAGRLVAREVLTLPDGYDPAVEAMRLGEEEGELYAEVVLDALHDRGDDPEQHQLLGHAAPIQSEMSVECERVTRGLTFADANRLPAPERAALETEARRWRLLAQFDSDGAVDMMWGDAGMLYFWITEEDLAARRFDRVWMILQCS